MKKLITAIIAILFCFSIASADGVNLQNFSFEQLKYLRDQFQMEIMRREEFKQATVKAGVYHVGENFPAGHWTVKCEKKNGISYVSFGDKLNAAKDGIDYLGSAVASVMNGISGQGSVYADVYPQEYSFEVNEGQYVIVTGSNLILSTYIGQPLIVFGN